MKPRTPDAAWSLLRGVIRDVLSPLLVIGLALYVSLGYILSGLLPLTGEHWLALFWLCLLLPLPPLCWRARDKWRDDARRRPRYGWSALFSLSPLLLLAPAFALEFSSPTLQILHHADVHLAFIHQLQRGTTPLESVFAPGYPPLYHWLFHAALTPLVSLTGYAAPSVATLVTVVAMGVAFVWISRVLEALELFGSRSWLRTLMILLVYMSFNLTCALTVLSHLAAGAWTGFSNHFMLLPGANRHLHSMLKQVLNFNSVALGMLLFSAALYAIVKMSRDKPDASTLILFSATGIGALAVREIAALYIVCGLFGGYMLMLSLEWLRSATPLLPHQWLWRELTRKCTPGFLALWLAISLALSLPLVKYNLDITGSFDAGKPYGLSLPNLQMIAAALLLFLPLFALNFRFVWRSRSRAQSTLQYACALATLLTFVLTLPDANQSKAVYFLGMLMALAALCASTHLETGATRLVRRIGKLTPLVFGALLIGQIVYVSSNFAASAWNYARSGYRYQGLHIEHSDDDFGGRMAGYLWLRDNTLVDAVVALPINETPRSNLFHERALYLRQMHQHFATSNIDPTERLHHLGVIYDADIGAAEYSDIITRMEQELPRRQFFAVIKESEVGQRNYAATRRGACLPGRGGRGACLLAQSEWIGRRGADADSRQFHQRGAEPAFHAVLRLLRRPWLHPDFAHARYAGRMGRAVLAVASDSAAVAAFAFPKSQRRRFNPGLAHAIAAAAGADPAAAGRGRQVLRRDLPARLLR